jgi:hypothetical protein
VREWTIAIPSPQTTCHSCSFFPFPPKEGQPTPHSRQNQSRVRQGKARLGRENKRSPHSFSPFHLGKPKPRREEKRREEKQQNQEGVAVNMEDRSSHKRALLDFLDQNIYKDEIKAMINHKRRRLIINISDLHSFQDFGPRYLTFFITSDLFSTKVFIS